MIESLLTNTRIICLDAMTEDILDRMIFYLAGKDASVAVIADPRPFPLRDKMLMKLTSLRDTVLLNKVRPNPETSDIMEMCRELEGRKVSVVIGIGGGSTMDSAKGVAAILANGGNLEDYLGNFPTLKIKNRDVKLILVPTTVGTGSEVTKVAVFTSASGRKYTLGSPMLQADVAVLVADYVKDIPSQLVASTGIDALSHALEAIWNKNAVPETDAAASESAVLVLENIESAYRGNFNALKNMQKGACMAGIAFSMTGTAMVHAISFVLSEEWHVPHGIACAFTLEDAFDYNLKDARTRSVLAGIAARVIGEKGSEETLLHCFRDKIIALKKTLCLPSSFNDLDISMSRDSVSRLFAKSLDDPKMKNNIIPLDLHTLCDIIYKKL